MLQKVKGISLRTVKYGDTSVIVTLFTDLFGLQSYIVSGVRKESVKGSVRAAMFTPGTLLELVVYHQEKQGLQRIREARWAVLYKEIDKDIIKNGVVVFMVELLHKCLRQPDAQPELFAFMEDALITLDTSSSAVVANFPIYFALHLSHFFGFRMQDNLDRNNILLDLREGYFVDRPALHPDWVSPQISDAIAQFLKAQHPEDLTDIRLSREGRRLVLDACLRYYAIHVHDFGHLRTLPVLQELLD